MGLTLAQYLKENDKQITNEINFQEYWSHVAFHLDRIGALVLEKDSDEVKFIYFFPRNQIFYHIFNPKEVEVVSQIPLAIKGKPASERNQIDYRTKRYKDALAQLAMVGLPSPPLP